MEEDAEKYLFEKMPVPKAVATLAIPTIISQVVTMIYNLADTFFVGQLGDPLMVAAVSLVSPWFNLLTALGNLFGLGGSSLISRMMGAQNHKDIKYVSVFSIWGGAAVTLLFSLGTWVARVPLLDFLGASPDTYGYAEYYLFASGQCTIQSGGACRIAGQLFQWVPCSPSLQRRFAYRCAGQQHLDHSARARP